MSLWAFWWQLPGPSSFLDRVVSDGKDGSSLVLEWPEHGPLGWQAGLQRHDKNWAGDRVRCEFRATDFNAVEPEMFLFERIFGREISPLRITPESLVRFESFQGRVIVLDGMNADAWDLWRPFLESYAEAARSVEVWRRTQFIVSLTGKACLKSPKKSGLLKAYRWDGYTTPLDMQMYAAYLIRDRAFRNLERKLMYALLARLSGWDPMLLDALVASSVSELCMPEAVLNAFAAGRGWGQDVPGNREEAWALGMLQRFDEEDVVHGCLSDESRAEDSVAYRLWHAQTEVLLPVVERERHRIVARLRGKLEVPYDTAGGIIEDERDLELSHIFVQMNQYRDRFRDADRELVKMLRDIRNELAHFEPVSANLLGQLLRRF